MVFGMFLGPVQSSQLTSAVSSSKFPIAVLQCSVLVTTHIRNNVVYRCCYRSPFAFFLIVTGRYKTHDGFGPESAHGNSG